MHVFLISACERKAWPRSRAVLDSYAVRVGERAWSTPITLEGLGELRGQLKRKATRQTAVACYRNDGNLRMKLLWVVGARDTFGPDGHYPAGFTRLPAPPLPVWFKDVALLAQVGGYLHDRGKSGEAFAGKLAASVSGGEFVEAVRHEWVSLCLFREAMSQGSEHAWQGVSTASKITSTGSLKSGVSSKLDAVEYLIATHHRLLGGYGDLTPTAEGHIKGTISSGGLKPAGEVEPNLMRKAERLLQRLGRPPVDGEAPGGDYWRPVATLARAALIMADHQVSSVDYRKTVVSVLGDAASASLYANTKKDEATGGRRYDQPLDWHLRQVAEKAADYAYRIATARFEPLAEMTIEAILEPAQVDRFAWQDEGARFLKRARRQSSAPALVFSMAGTGAGKTQANAKFACALSDQPRFSVALNLRSLTLQTGDSLRDDLGLAADELAVVIGDKVSEQLHEASRSALSIDEEADTELSVIADAQALPEWLEPLNRSGKAAQLLMPPVLVSTVDFLVRAAEPGRQGHHVLALLRMMNSDLILDELDSYDPKSLVAILRLIQTAAMLGRNVICSSATMSTPVVCAVYEAFLSGIRMQAALENATAPPLVAFIDNELPPVRVVIESFAPETLGAVREVVTGRQQGIMAALKAKDLYRMPVLLKIGARDLGSFYQAIEQGARQFHADHQWLAGNGKQLSFGLVRVANIKTAIPVARYLAAAWPEARIACYHANELRIQRHLKEKKLDRLLSRKKGSVERILADPDIRAALAQSDSVPFIVVATPVEEIGRDHDFDWAVVEPSSAHSIVQVCGRVNRHRLEPVSRPNVGLLEFNARYAVGQGKGGCFTKPGLESKRHSYGSTNLGELIEWSELDRIDASLRFGDHPMARDEDRLIEKRLEAPMETLRGDPGNEAGWLCRGFYDKYPLRDNQATQRFRLVPHRTVPAAGYVLDQLNQDSLKTPPYRPVWRESMAFSATPRCANDWLVWSDAELSAAAEEAGIDPEDGMTLEIADYSKKDGQVDLLRDESFGFQLRY